MKEFVFSEIEKINDFQFINDNEGFFLSDKGSLYHFSGMQSKKMFTPQEYQPTKIVFSDELNGAIAGNGGTVENLIQKSSFESSSIAIVILIILVLLVKRLKIFAKKRTMVSMEGV